jgi:hypothetical protein
MLPPVEIVETLPPIVERVEYIEPARIVQRVERRSVRATSRPRLTDIGQARYSWSGDLRELMRQQCGLSAATLAELSDAQVVALYELECDQ